MLRSCSKRHAIMSMKNRLMLANSRKRFVIKGKILKVAIERTRQMPTKSGATLALNDSNWIARYKVLTWTH